VEKQLCFFIFDRSIQKGYLLIISIIGITLIKMNRILKYIIQKYKREFAGISALEVADHCDLRHDRALSEFRNLRELRLFIL